MGDFRLYLFNLSAYGQENTELPEPPPPLLLPCSPNVDRNPLLKSMLAPLQAFCNDPIALLTYRNYGLLALYHLPTPRPIPRSSKGPTAQSVNPLIPSTSSSRRPRADVPHSSPSPICPPRYIQLR